MGRDELVVWLPRLGSFTAKSIQMIEIQHSDFDRNYPVTKRGSVPQRCGGRAYICRCRNDVLACKKDNYHATSGMQHLACNIWHATSGVEKGSRVEGREGGGGFLALSPSAASVWESAANQS
jgi:hypothetical protein